MEIIKVFALSSLLILIQESLSKKNIKKLLMLKPHFFVVNTLILFDIILLLSFFIKNYYPILQIIIIICILLGIANRIKIDYRQTGFTPIDFLVFREAKSMTGALNKKSMLNLALISASLITLLLLLSITIYYEPLKNNTNYFILIISIIFFLAFYFLGPLYNQRISIYKVGAIFYFLSYLNNPPKFRITKKQRTIDYDIKATIKKDAPDIIIIQSESFVDPFVLGKDKFNKDPLPFYRSLLNETYSFSISTRAFGGGTVHTEYEILTGLSSIFFPRDTTVFSRYIKRPLPSIGSIMKNQGYDSLLIHPYLKWYYNRTEVYRRLGFDKFLSIKTFKNNKSKYISDLDLFKRIINELDDGNKLIMGVTMQNHTPYNSELYQANNVNHFINFTNKGTSIHFNNYLNGLAQTDASLEYLIETLKKRDRETILLFYGDHLPVINQDSSFYEESNWSEAEFDSWKYYFDLSKSPGFIWSNKRTIKSKSQNIDATSVLPMLLSLLKIDYPEYLQELGKLFETERINGLFREFIVKDGNLFGSKSPEYIKIFGIVKNINEAVFNDSEFDKWCYESNLYTVN